MSFVLMIVSGILDILALIFCYLFGNKGLAICLVLLATGICVGYQSMVKGRCHDNCRDNRRAQRGTLAPVILQCILAIILIMAFAKHDVNSYTMVAIRAWAGPALILVLVAIIAYNYLKAKKLSNGMHQHGNTVNSNMVSLSALTDTATRLQQNPAIVQMPTFPQNNIQQNMSAIGPHLVSNVQQFNSASQPQYGNVGVQQVTYSSNSSTHVTEQQILNMDVNSLSSMIMQLAPGLNINVHGKSVEEIIQIVLRWVPPVYLQTVPASMNDMQKVAYILNMVLVNT